MKKKGIRFVLALLAVGLMTFRGPHSYADESPSIDELKASISDKEDQIDGLQDEKAALVSGRSNLQAMIDRLNGQRAELSAYVTELDAQVAEIQANIDQLKELIAKKEEEVRQSEEELERAVEEEEAQYEAMKIRIRLMYEKGDAFYLETLLLADSFSDMLNKAEYIEAVLGYDRRMLEEFQLVEEYARLCREELKQEQEVLEEAKEVAEEEQENVNALIAEKEAQISAYDSDIANTRQVISQYDAEIAAQNREILALEAAVAAEKEQLAEATRIHYNGGVFCWPAPDYTRISDNYGWRMHPTLHVQKFHNGVDLAAPGGSPILAAYDGKVVAAAYSSSMGNYIMIDHGDGLYTIYMHASALYVSKGATVTRGQKIAAVGTTGRSTGNHLHFSVRLNGNYVDPMSYIG